MAFEKASLMAVRGSPEECVEVAVDMDGEYTHARAGSCDFPPEQAIPATTETVNIIII